MVELKVGDRVAYTAFEEYNNYTGIIFHIESGGLATIKRDDKETGSGKTIPGYGRGWTCYIKNLTLVKPQSWKERIED